MNKVFTSLLIIAALVLTTTSCVAQKSSDNRITWTVPVTSFTEITDNSSIDIHYVESDSYGVTVKAPEELQQYVLIGVKGSTLHVSMKPHRIHSTKYGVDVIVKAPRLNSVKLSGSGDFEANSLSANDFDAFINGSSDIRIGKLSCNGELTLRSSGSGDISVDEASSTNISMKSSGAGDIRVTAKETKDVTCYSSGSGDISTNVNASGSVMATSTGSGDIFLSGSARSIRERSSGSGDIHSRGLKTN